MTMTAETIDHATLENLVQAGAVRGTSVVAQSGGWGVVIAYGTAERALAAKRGAVRIFRRFETLASYLKSLGITRYEVDAKQYDPELTKTTTKRSDAADRMRQAHQAAAYKGWLTKEVQDAIDDPRPSIPHDEVMAEWKTERAALAKQAKQMKAGH
jgi:hypothetical protein